MVLHIKQQYIQWYNVIYVYYKIDNERKRGGVAEDFETFLSITSLSAKTNYAKVLNLETSQGIPLITLSSRNKNRNA